MSHVPIISLITPTYNRAGILGRAIASARGQTFADFEHIIVDDGSTDDTKRLVQSIGDPRLRYFYQPNAGATAARNFGIARARGQWIMYLDSDDELLPECMATMLDWLGRHPQAVFAFPRADRVRELYEDGRLVKSIDDSDDTPPEFTIHDIFMRNAGFGCDGFTHLRRLFDEGLKWDENLHSMEDWEFMMSIGERYPDGFLYVPVVLYKYRQRYGSDNLVSQAEYKTWADAFEHIYQRHQYDKLLQGQTWYPAKVEKWNRYQAEFEAGRRKPYRYHYFENARNRVTYHRRRNVV